LILFHAPDETTHDRFSDGCVAATGRIAQIDNPAIRPAQFFQRGIECSDGIAIAKRILNPDLSR
jgi:hypothetical protein